MEVGIDGYNKTVDNVFGFDGIVFFGSVYERENIVLHFIIKLVLLKIAFGVFFLTQCGDYDSKKRK
jgi:hypothetical protein